jgi:hypothetical protein
MMKTLASLALLAAGATAQIIESSSFGTGEKLVQCPCSVFTLWLSDPGPEYHQTRILSPDGQLEERAMHHTL